MLRRKIKLMHAGRIDEANALAHRTGRNSVHFRRRNWHVALGSSTYRSSESVNSITADLKLNRHSAKYTSCQPPPTKSTCSSPSDLFTEFQVFRILDSLHHTATGLDDIPAWFLKIGAPLLYFPLAKLFNLSLGSVVVHSQWKAACITPVAKVTHPAAASDYRPISITPVLSRRIERIIVRSFSYPYSPWARPRKFRNHYQIGGQRWTILFE